MLLKTIPNSLIQPGITMARLLELMAVVLDNACDSTSGTTAFRSAPPVGCFIDGSCRLKSDIETVYEILVGFQI